MKSKAINYIVTPLIISVYAFIVIAQNYGLFTFTGIERKAEIFPFFSWSLFSRPVSNFENYFIEVTTVAGESLVRPGNLISSGQTSISLHKVVSSNIRTCQTVGLEACAEKATAEISPFIDNVRRFTHQDLEYYLVKCFISDQQVYEAFKMQSGRIPKISSCSHEIRIGPLQVVR